ncbi:MAG: permease-like cell division protein FtsX [Desulfobacteraceae bacterium]|nr:permease-like cell division protein FtsX [Desulfobacteraceae bacterium]
MIIYCKRAIKDILDHRFLSTVTIVTIAIAILISSAFALFFINANAIVNSWKKGIRIMVYLKPNSSEIKVADIKSKIEGMKGVENVRFISNKEALERLKNQMKRQSSLLDDLQENPLPDAFEVRLTDDFQNQDKVETLAARLESLSQVDEVEYGQVWLGRFTNILNLFRLTGYAMGVLFFVATVLIVANTIRLVLYSRREEVEIMRLVGATDGFIRAPFYVEGLIQGALGGIIGLAALFVLFMFISSNVDKGLTSSLFAIRFLSWEAFLGILICSMFVGWMGCFLSLKQFLKQ